MRRSDFSAAVGVAKNREMVRKLYSVDPQTANRKLIATFAMVGKKLGVEWEKGSDYYRDGIEIGGIVSGEQVLKPSDGRDFYDALPLAYSRSSTMYVVDT